MQGSAEQFIENSQTDSLPGTVKVEQFKEVNLNTLGEKVLDCFILQGLIS